MRDSSWSPLTVAGLLFSLMVMLTGGVLIFQAGSGKAVTSSGRAPSPVLTTAPTHAPSAGAMMYAAGAAIRSEFAASSKYFNLTYLSSTTPVALASSAATTTASTVSSTTSPTPSASTTPSPPTIFSAASNLSATPDPSNTSSTNVTDFDTTTSDVYTTTTSAVGAPTTTAPTSRVVWSTTYAALQSSLFGVDVNTVCNTTGATASTVTEMWPSSVLSLRVLVQSDAYVSAPSSVGAAPVGSFPSRSAIVPTIPSSAATVPAAPASPSDQSATLRFHYFSTTLTATPLFGGAPYALNLRFPIAATLWQAVICPSGYICDNRWVSMCIASQLWNNPCRGGYYCGLCYLAYYVAANTEMGVPVTLNASNHLVQASSAAVNPWVSFAAPHDPWAYRYADSDLAMNMTLSLRLTSDPSVAIGTTDLVDEVDGNSAQWASQCQAATPSPADSDSDDGSNAPAGVGVSGSGSSLWGAVVDDSSSKESKRLRTGGIVTLIFGTLLGAVVLARHCYVLRASRVAFDVDPNQDVELGAVVTARGTGLPGAQAAVGTVVPRGMVVNASVAPPPIVVIQPDPSELPPMYPAALGFDIVHRGYLDVGGFDAPAEKSNESSVRTEQCE